MNNLVLEKTKYSANRCPVSETKRALKRTYCLHHDLPKLHLQISAILAVSRKKKYSITSVWVLPPSPLFQNILWDNFVSASWTLEIARDNNYPNQILVTSIRNVRNFIHFSRTSSKLKPVARKKYKSKRKIADLERYQSEKCSQLCPSAPQNSVTRQSIKSSESGQWPGTPPNPRNPARPGTPARGVQSPPQSGLWPKSCKFGAPAHRRLELLYFPTPWLTLVHSLFCTNGTVTICALLSSPM